VASTPDAVLTLPVAVTKPLVFKLPPVMLPVTEEKYVFKLLPEI
jgi:hypothetical protein